MIQCPACGQALEDEFGLIHCPGCGVSLFLELNGEVKLCDEEVSSENSQVFASDEESISAPSDEIESLDELHSDFSSNDEMQAEAESSDFGSFEGPQEEMSAESSGENSGYESEPLEDFSFEESHEVGSDSGPLRPLESPSMGGGLLDTSATVAPSSLAGAGLSQELTEYANSEVSLGRDGSLKFNVIVEGIDTPDIRYAISEALKDRKFIWDTNAIVRSIDKGVLKIEGISPVKAAIFIKRIKNLPVEIRWEQYAIQQI